MATSTSVVWACLAGAMLSLGGCDGAASDVQQTGGARAWVAAGGTQSAGGGGTSSLPVAGLVAGTPCYDALAAYTQCNSDNCAQYCNTGGF